jgi:hypothetical protein
MEREEERPSEEGSHGHPITPEDAVPDEATPSEPGGRETSGTDHVVEEKGREDEAD